MLTTIKMFQYLLMTMLITANIAQAETSQVTAQPKSPTTATTIALAGFFVPVGMIAMAGLAGDEGATTTGLVIAGFAGTLFGPGLGHAYAGETGRFWRGTGMRTLAWGGVAGAFAVSWDNPDADGAGILAVVSTVLYLYSTISDIATASDSAEKYNARVNSGSVEVAPTYELRDRSLGLRVSWNF